MAKGGLALTHCPLPFNEGGLHKPGDQGHTLLNSRNYTLSLAQ